jgi:hypothetical protein
MIAAGTHREKTDQGERRQDMKGRSVAVTAALMLFGVAAGVTWVGGASAAASRSRVIRIDAVASQENFVDVDPVGPSLGDTLIVHDDWKNANGRVVGFDGVVCTAAFIDREGNTQYHCQLTGHLGAGLLTAQGFFTEPAVEPPGGAGVLAVTGGTGGFVGAAGTVKVEERSEEETQYTFVLTSQVEPVRARGGVPPPLAAPTGGSS